MNDLFLDQRSMAADQPYGRRRKVERFSIFVSINRRSSAFIGG